MRYFEDYAINEQDIAVPPNLKKIISMSGLGTYFKPFSSKRTGTKELSYNQMLGTKIKEIVDKLLEYKNNPEELNPEQPILAQNEEDIMQAIKLIYPILYGKDFFEKTLIKRNIMLNGSTLPLKINFIEQELITKSMYIKKPNTNRLIGLFMYNLIQNHQKTRFCYNEKVFIEQEVKAKTLLQEDEELLFLFPEYKEGIGRAAAQAEFLGLKDDVIAK